MTKIGTVWGREHPKNFGTLYFILQLLKLDTSSLLFGMGVGVVR